MQTERVALQGAKGTPNSAHQHVCRFFNLFVVKAHFFLEKENSRDTPLENVIKKN